MNNEKMYTYEKISLSYIYLYRLLGFLPFDNEFNESSILRFFFQNTGIFFFITSTMHSTMHIGNVIRMIKEHRIEIDCICELFICENIYLRYCMLLIHRQEILALMRFCRKLSLSLTLDEGKFIRKFERKVNVLKNFIMWTIMITVTLYAINSQLVRIPSEDANGTRRRMLPIKFFVEVEDNALWYTVVAVLQVTVSYASAVILAGVDSVGAFLILMACGYLKAIQHRLLSMTKKDTAVFANVPDTNIRKLPVDEILNCVKFHQNIMEFCEKIEEITSGMFMMQILCTTYNISFIGLTLIQTDEGHMRYVSLLALNFLQFFTCHWISEHLLTESEAIESAAYSATLSHSYYDYEANQMLLFMMIRAQKPVQLSAGGIVRLSLESSQRMFVNAYSFFAVLR